MRKATYFEAGGFPKDYINSTDYHLFLNVSLKNKIMFLPKTTCQYREHSQNLSKYNIVKSVEEEDTLKHFVKSLKTLQLMRT